MAHAPVAGGLTCWCRDQIAAIGVGPLVPVAICVAVTIASGLLLARFLGKNHAIGILLGVTIHDIAQVVGAGYAVSEEAGDVATFVTLVRVLPLPVVILGIVLAGRGRDTGGRFPVLWFVVLFAAIGLLRNTGIVPEVVGMAMSDLLRRLLVVAISALGGIALIGGYGAARRRANRIGAGRDGGAWSIGTGALGLVLTRRLGKPHSGPYPRMP